MTASSEHVFELDHSPLAADAQTAPLAEALGDFSRIDSPERFNAYCRLACRAWTKIRPVRRGATSPRFDELAARIDHEEENVIVTGWGGVVITHYEHPQVEKYLIVRRGGYLALEKHDEKDERLEVREGAGLILHRAAPRGPLRVEVLQPGDTFHFEPGVEHCLIGTEDLLVHERSTDPKGMDQDLIFLFTPQTQERDT